MNYRKSQTTKMSNRILEYRHFNNKSLSEDVKFTMGAEKEIIKMIGGKTEDLSQEEINEVKLNKTTDDPKMLKMIEKLNQKFGLR
jgi:hypothetical protein